MPYYKKMLIILKHAKDVEQLIESVNRNEKEKQMVQNNFLKIENEYNWPDIIEQYNEFIIDCYNQKSKMKKSIFYK